MRFEAVKKSDFAVLAVLQLIHDDERIASGDPSGPEPVNPGETVGVA